MNRISNIDWLPIEFAKRDLKPGSEQIVVLYRPRRDASECYLEYSTSNPDFACGPHAIEQGYTEFAVLIDA